MTTYNKSEQNTSNATNDGLIYYYCSIDTFISILSNCSLYVSDPTKMNDAEEFYQSTKLLKDKVIDNYFDQLIEMLSQRPPTGWDSQDIKRINKDALIEYIRIVDRTINNYPNLSVFIVCFSKNKDLLSQWNKYADQGHGVAIGFNPKELINGCDCFQKFTVRYVSDFCTNKSIESQLNSFAFILRTMLTSILLSSKSTFTEAERNRYFSPYIDYPEIDSIDPYIRQRENLYGHNLLSQFGKDRIETIIKNFLFGEYKRTDEVTGKTELISPNLCVLTPYFLSTLLRIKNQGFKEEEEVRLIFCNGRKTISKYPRKVRKIQCGDRDSLTPYITLSFDPSAVKKIIIGPKCQVTSREIEQLLTVSAINQIIASGGSNIEINTNSSCSDVHVTARNTSKSKFDVEIEISNIKFR